MHRLAQTIRLRPEKREEYLALHREDFAADMASIAADPDTRRWWQLTDPCQEPWPDAGTGGHWSDLTEIWHLDKEDAA